MKSIKPVQVIAVTGGKGGVGKSNVSVNTAVCMAELGRKVIVLDGDLGLANIDILLGIRATKTISDVLSGFCSLEDIMIDGPSGIKIIPASSGTADMANIGPREHAGIIHAFSELDADVDTLIVDTAAGISHSVINFVQAAQEVVVVVCDEPTSITDAYALIKLMNHQCHVDRFRILANMIRTPKEGTLLYQKLVAVCDRFLDVSLQYLGAVPFDENVRKAVQRQKPVVELYPRTKASIAYRSIADRMAGFPVPSSPRGHLEFFVERLIQGSMSH